VAGGGGGYGTVGSNGVAGTSTSNWGRPGDGGAGLDASAYFGVGVGAAGWFAGGGGGGLWQQARTGSNGSLGGKGGGGAGACNLDAVAGAPSTGGGGGGASYYPDNERKNPGAGGSGIVIIRYKLAPEVTVGLTWPPPPPANTWYPYQSSVTFTAVTFTATSPTVKFYTNSAAGPYGQAGGDQSTVTSTVTVASLEAAEYHVYATAVDGGTTVTSVTHTFTIAAPLTVSVTAPTNNQAFAYNESITATGVVSGGMAPYNVTFYTNVAAGDYGLAGSGSSPISTVSLYVLPGGTYHIYATVGDSLGTTNTSPTNTFSVEVYTGTKFKTDGYWVHVFSNGIPGGDILGTFVVDTRIINVEYMIVGGGGAGGGATRPPVGGGGGAGGITNNLGNPWATLAPGTYPIVIGGGGTANAGASGGNGRPSSAFGITANGGGGGGCNAVVGNGGCGGGGSASQWTGWAGGTGSQGKNGGSGTGSDGAESVAGGGGGYGTVGSNGVARVFPAWGRPGDGGAGFDASAYFGVGVGAAGWLAGGGGGGLWQQGRTGSNGSLGGKGGGGAGACDLDAVAGAPSTGGGGGGASYYPDNERKNPGAGGSGIVIIRYQIPPSGTLILLR